jgi:uncharacterized membrane protein
MSTDAEVQGRSFPWSAGILIGLGLGGFFDGIVLHQMLQWHHMLSNWYPINSLPNLELNTRWDGYFHSATYVFVVAGIFVLWRHTQLGHSCWSSKLLGGTLFIGWGLFNLVEGLIDHELLGVHHVNELVAREDWVYWDIGFLAWGAAMFTGGWQLFKAGRAEHLTASPTSA